MITEIENTKALKEKVEGLGVLMEKFGRTPIEGRVISYLLLAEPSYRSFDDIVEFIQAGKSSVSNALTMFQKEGTVSYRTFSGDRKRYFMINAEGWKKSFEDSVTNLTALNVMLEDVLKFRTGSEDSDFNANLRELLDFQTHVTNELTKTIHKWNNR